MKGRLFFREMKIFIRKEHFIILLSVLNSAPSNVISNIK